jgi:hypothetical protein
LRFRIFSQWRIVRDLTWMGLLFGFWGGVLYIVARRIPLSIESIDVLIAAIAVAAFGCGMLVSAVWSEYRYGQLEKLKSG